MSPETGVTTGSGSGGVVGIGGGGGSAAAVVVVENTKMSTSKELNNGRTSFFIFPSKINRQKPTYIIYNKPMTKACKPTTKISRKHN